MSSTKSAPYVKLLHTHLEQCAPTIFQLRKLGVKLEIPTEVRQQVVAEFGANAANHLALIDGQVHL